MSIEKLGKIGISVGIAVGVLMLLMLGLALPDQIDRLNPRYNTPVFEPTSETEIVNVKFLMEKFSNTEEYKIFVQRYPEHVEDLDMYDTGGHLLLLAVNTDSNNVLELRLDTNMQQNWRIEANAQCSIGSSLDGGDVRARDSAVSNYLMKTDCLD